MLYVLGGEKGGTGKTALAVNLSVCLAIRGRDVLLVDADPQRSASKWAAKRAARSTDAQVKLPRVNWAELTGEIFEALCDLRKRYQDVIVDVGGTDQPELRYALSAADRLYSPMVPSLCDMETARELHDLVKEVRAIGNRALRAHVVLNKCPTHAHDDEVAEAREELEELPLLELAKTTVAYRKPWRTAYKNHVGVVELPLSPDRRTREAARKASDEAWAFYAEITGDNERQ